MICIDNLCILCTYISIPECRVWLVRWSKYTTLFGKLWNGLQLACIEFNIWFMDYWSFLSSAWTNKAWLPTRIFRCAAQQQRHAGCLRYTALLLPAGCCKRASKEDDAAGDLTGLLLERWQLLNPKTHVATFSWHIWDTKENTWLLDVFLGLRFWYFRILMDSGWRFFQEWLSTLYTLQRPRNCDFLHILDKVVALVRHVCMLNMLEFARFSEILNSPVGCLNLWLFRIAKSCMIRIHIDGRKEEMQQKCVPKAQIKNACPIIDVWPNLFAESFWVFQHPGNPCCGWGTSKRTKDADVSPRATWSLNGKLAENNFASFPMKGSKKVPLVES